MLAELMHPPFQSQPCGITRRRRAALPHRHEFCSPKNSNAGSSAIFCHEIDGSPL